MPQIPWTTGVYWILNLVTEKYYVGGAYKDFEERKQFHIWQLRNKRHFNSHLQRSWNKYGEEAFEFVVLERCSPKRVEEREQYYLDLYQASNKEYGYNLSPTAGSTLGLKWSEQSKEKKRQQAIEQMSNPETRRKNSETSKELWKDEEYARKQKEAQRPKKMRNHWADPEKRAKHVAHKQSQTYLDRQRENALKQFADPVKRARNYKAKIEYLLNKKLKQLRERGRT